MKILTTLAFVGGALALAPLVLAQEVDGPLDSRQETGTAFRRSAKSVDDLTLVNRYSKSVAECVTNRVGDQVRTLLRHSDPQRIDYDSSGVNRARFMRTIERCMGQRLQDFSNNILLANLSMSLTDSRLRALLLEEAYLEDNDIPPAIGAGDSEQTNRPYVTMGNMRVTAQGLGAFSDCIAFNDAGSADTLLRTEPGSDGEMQAARALAPTLGDCMIAGQQIEFTPASIRAMAADGLWTRVNFSQATAE